MHDVKVFKIGVDISWGQPLHDRLPVGGCSLSMTNVTISFTIKNVFNIIY